MNKQELRRHFLALRNELKEQQRTKWSRDICALLHSCPKLKQAKTVAAYYPLGSEVDLRPLLEQLAQEGKRLALPISYSGGVMVFHEAKLETLEQGLYGIFQPPECSAVIVPEKIDGMLVPGVVFDSMGGRIGYGKGYYDRILQQYHGWTMGICYAAQMTENVFSQPHDVPLQYLVNETGIHKAIT
ncbi:MAG: 5-formyltetrahydrofolate cyclo-ligase [Clostridia bacterium]|nr:5-formyltetrahydrofolate cyclo-ligase [Clostridia bacterium]